MRKIITDPMQVKVGDKAYFKGCDSGFTVVKTDNEDQDMPFKVSTPFCDTYFWVRSSYFDHAIREDKEQEWPDPHDFKLHVYLGADGRRYICNPCSEQDTCPWTVENSIGFVERQQMAHIFHEALPLTEFKFVPVKDDGNEQ
jgi:hypothetical protein